MEDILLIDKPAGITSFDVIRRLRERTGVRKMGHAGTLDPLATGLLVVGVGKGTKRLAAFTGLPKTYRMAVLLGRRTGTGDIEGVLLEERRVGAIARAAVEEVLRGMTGELELPIPMYSAVKYRGKPLYHYARRGIAVPARTRKTRIYRLELGGIRKTAEGPVLDAELEAGTGTYARAVAEEIGRRLGLPATISGLRRTRVGDWRVEEAVPLADFMAVHR